MGRSGAARTAESAVCVRSAWARRSPAPGAEPGRRSKCALSALAAALRRRASQDQCLQPAGWCARARGVCVRALPWGVYSQSCLLNPVLECTFHPECEHAGTEAVSYRRGRGGDETQFKFPSSTQGWGSARAGLPRCPLRTPVAQLRGRFRALCAFSDTLAGSAPSPATRTERTLGSEPRALQPHGAAERALSFPTRVCKSEVENSRRAQPPPFSQAPPQPWLGVEGEFPRASWRGSGQPGGYSRTSSAFLSTPIPWAPRRISLF